MLYLARCKAVLCIWSLLQFTWKVNRWEFNVASIYCGLLYNCHLKYFWKLQLWNCLFKFIIIEHSVFWLFKYTRNIYPSEGHIFLWMGKLWQWTNISIGYSSCIRIIIRFKNIVYWPMHHRFLIIICLISYFTEKSIVQLQSIYKIYI